METEQIRWVIDMFKSLYADTKGDAEDALKELEELERIATEYESNKHYIELGKAYLKWCNLNGKAHRVFDNVAIPFEEDLLEWAEGRE